MVVSQFERVGLAVVDMQTVHLGHAGMLNAMRMSCGRGIIGFGSVNQAGVYGHPFTFDQRVAMIKELHGDFFEFVPLHDIDGSFHITEWYDYVKSKIAAAGLPDPSDYFTGSEVDAKYYFHEFATLNDTSTMQGDTVIYSGVNRFTERQCVEINREYHLKPEYSRVERLLTMKKRLHIVDRHATKLPSGRDIRLMIELRDEKWKTFVPERLHDYIERNYPPHLRVPILAADLSEYFVFCPTRYVENPDLISNLTYGRDFPVGTRILCYPVDPVSDHAAKIVIQKGFIVGDNERNGPFLFELKDDGKWRPLKKIDEKAEFARQALEAAAKGKNHAG